MTGALRQASDGRDSRQPELVFGLIGALGADLAAVASALRRELRETGYRVSDDPIKLSALMHTLPGRPFSTLRQAGKRAPVEQYMDAGTTLRERLGRADALALYAVSAIRTERKTEFGSDPRRPANGVAFILDSLKHNEEVETLRRLYGSAFIAVGVYTPYEQRVAAVQKRLHRDAGHGMPEDHASEAKRLMQKDQDERDKSFGQHVSDAFALADVVVSTAAAGASSIERFIQLLFGDWTKTPTRDEVGMTHAQIAGYQSSSMARQVGAAICRADGTIVATGTNDVPKQGGGVFGADDLDAGMEDVRDFSAFGYDTSDDQRRELLTDVLERLIKAELIPAIEVEKPRLAAGTMLQGPNAIMKRAKFMATIDYIRAMHAEAAAFSACVLHGLSTKGCTLYVTTFPCHDCTKMIVANGLGRVVYVEPYAKSLAQKFYDRQIDVDRPRRTAENVLFEPFVGVAPRRFRELFAMTGDRKDATGNYRPWNKSGAVPRLPESFASLSARAAGEAAESERFGELVSSHGLTPAP
jgi:cytidine deaminase